MLRLLTAIAALALASTTVSAKTVIEQYDVMSYSPSGHSLYMNGSKYHFEPGATFKRYDDDTGSLTGTALNSMDNGYEVSLSFANFRDWTQQQAVPSGAKGANLGDESTWTFMDLVDDSTLTGVGALSGSNYSLKMKPFNGNYTFQYGVGANDKQAGVLGLSGWFYTVGAHDNGTGYPCKKNANSEGGSVCDFNLKMTPVPVPAGIALLPVGLGALVALRRRKRRAAA